MKIYSDVLTVEDLGHACDGIPAVYLNGGHLVEGRRRRLEGVTIRAHSAERLKNWRELDDTARTRTGTGMNGGQSMPQNATYGEHGR